MEMGLIKKISKGICLLLIFILMTYNVINISLSSVLNKKTISRGIKDISFTDVIYSDTFDGNKKIESFRSNLNKIYKIVGIFGISEEEVNKLLNDSVRSDTTSIMVSNVVYTIKTGDSILLISEEDFKIIIDEFVDKVLDELNLNSVEKKLIGKKISEIGYNLIKYVPETDYVIDKISNNKYNTFRFLINKNVLILSILFTLLSFLMFYVINNRFYYLFRDIARSLYGESIIITLFIIILFILANTKYKFMYGIVTIFTNALFNFLWLFLILGTTSILVFHIIDKKKKLDN